MKNDYGQSKALTDVAIDNARTQAIITEGRKKGSTDEEIAKKVFSDLTGEDFQYIDKEAKTILVLASLYNFIPEKAGNIPAWKAIHNYVYVAQGYLEHPCAIEFRNFIMESKTIKDVLDRILKCEEMELWQFLYYIKDLEEDWFLNYISTAEILKFDKLLVNNKGN